jgi:hypothetical protein
VNKNIGDRGAIPLAISLKQNSTLISLKSISFLFFPPSQLLRLYGNQIGDDGAKALAGVLEANQTMISLMWEYPQTEFPHRLFCQIEFE